MSKRVSTVGFFGLTIRTKFAFQTYQSHTGVPRADMEGGGDSVSHRTRKDMAPISLQQSSVEVHQHALVYPASSSNGHRLMTQRDVKEGNSHTLLWIRHVVHEKGTLVTKRVLGKETRRHMICIEIYISFS